MTIKLGAPKREGQITEKDRADGASATGIVKKKAAARGRPKGSTSTTNATTNNASLLISTANREASLKPAENMPLNRSSKEGSSEAVGLGMGTGATQVVETGIEPLTPTNFAPPLSNAGSPTRHRDDADVTEEVGNVDAKDEVNGMKPEPTEASFPPPAATNPVVRNSALSSGAPESKPSTFIPPEQPTIPAQVPVGAGEDLPGFSSHQNSQNYESVDSALFSTAPSSQVVDAAPDFTHEATSLQSPVHASELHQQPPDPFAHAHPPPVSRPTTSSSTPSSTRRLQTRDNLPIFTANSPIPFSNSTSKSDTTFMSLPSSHQLQQEASTRPLPQHAQQQSRDGRMEIALLVDDDNENRQENAGTSQDTLWDVPSTPQLQLGGKKR